MMSVSTDQQRFELDLRRVFEAGDGVRNARRALQPGGRLDPDDAKNGDPAARWRRPGTRSDL